MAEYAKPLRALPVDEIDTEAVLGVLQPLWQARPETASRLRGRIEAVLDAARAKGYISRNEANPARWRGHLDKLLPKRQKLTRGHLPSRSISFQRAPRTSPERAAVRIRNSIMRRWIIAGVGGFTGKLRDRQATAALIPAARMKAGCEHRVPLSSRALAILEELAQARTGEFVFAGQKAGKPLSGMAMEMVLRRMKVESATVHGFRSAFRDWCGEATSFPRELAEAALAHVAGDATERAYRRGDALEKRRGLMEAWANFWEPKAGSNVLSMTRPQAS